MSLKNSNDTIGNRTRHLPIDFYTLLEFYKYTSQLVWSYLKTTSFGVLNLISHRLLHSPSSNQHDVCHKVYNEQEYCDETALHIAEIFQLRLIQTTKDEFLQVSKLNTRRGHALIKIKWPHNFIIKQATLGGTKFSNKLSS